MKTLLQQVATGRYVRGQRAWTRKEECARTFRSSLTALDFCTRHDLSDVEIVLKFSDPRFDIRLHPFPNGQRESERKPESAARAA